MVSQPTAVGELLILSEEVLNGVVNQAIIGRCMGQVGMEYSGRISSRVRHSRLRQKSGCLYGILFYFILVGG